MSELPGTWKKLDGMYQVSLVAERQTSQAEEEVHALL
jgi:hypothetical protein